MPFVTYKPAAWQQPLAYSHAVEIPPGARTVHVAGQVAITPQGEIPDGIVAQTRLAFANLREVLQSAGLDFDNVVKTTVFLVDPADLEGFTKVRAETLVGIRPASSLVFVAQLARSAFRVEIEAVAAGNVR